MQENEILNDPRLLANSHCSTPADLARPAFAVPDAALFLQRTLTRSTTSDSLYVLDLSRKFSNQLGFIPREGLETYCAMGRVLIGRENDAPAGYLLGRNALRWQPLMRPIYQAAVQMDAQRRALGLTLIAQVEAEARAAGQLAIQACCRVGLDANEFWKAAGFQPICYMDPGNARKRHVICWRKALTKKIPLWFVGFPRLAGWKSKRVTQEQR